MSAGCECCLLLWLLTSCADACLSLNDTCVDCVAGAGDGPEVQFIAQNLDQHETSVLVKGGGGLSGRPHITLSKFSRCTGYEVENAFLRLQSLIDMVMAGEHDVDAVLDKDGLQNHA